MLVMVLGRQRMPLRNADLVTADDASIHARVGGKRPRREWGVERLVMGLRQMMTVLVQSHEIVLSF
ncbi:hypothetical protein [Roseateles terrae]|uniref:Transposase n=1 Tax=Roseateles terrae TaxID=431060 RepID=A0ABR6GZ35_9BURK|nr:hypothetical protein [Roseateles terrae]MBB3197366.1 hypothetical protein [Roseateles terrae]